MILFQISKNIRFFVQQFRFYFWLNLCFIVFDSQ